MRYFHIFVDDVKDPPAQEREYIIIRDMHVAFDLVTTLLQCKDARVIISLDHDMGDAYDSGSWFMDNLEQWYFKDYQLAQSGVNRKALSKVEIMFHSKNPVGRAYMEAVHKTMQKWMP